MKPSAHMQWRHRLQNLQGSVSIAAKTKVSVKWRDLNYTPDHHKFYYILEGEGRVVIDGEELFPKPGDMVVMPAGVKQSYQTVSENTFLKYWCHFTAQLGPLQLFKWLETPRVIRVMDEDHERVVALFEALIEAHQSHEMAAAIREKAFLFQLIDFYIEQCQSNAVDIKEENTLTEETEKLSVIFAYIEEHLHEKLTVRQLANRVHFHPNYFIRFFNEHVGVSPIQYLLQAKIEKAKTMLMDKRFSMADIAASLAMEPHYFSRTFKKKVGITPSEYRRLFG
ncbi:AraC family transcriptional regulator [Bacillaceae bacterium SIJ1]|uniref:AraC family transcriptional regulator n=1 Tax=Litoribacterium kuwaitense TaxID=1398745 RepID=UPI0013E9D8EC|nr:AraC family transcriptional regulator [Litoribacterium kuwaitense]NGP46729.1 AraC family transcriptional regulator [Litoribacterium kuwaitense]